jgi:ankyrin repeat protein
MDPLSIISSVIAIAAAAAQISTAISRLRHLGEVPGKIYALKNEVSDLEVVLRQVGHALEQRSLEPENEHGSLEQVLGRTKGLLNDLTRALERVAQACTGSRIKVISKSTIWLREKTVFQGLRDDIGSIKATLNLMLGAANSQSLHQIILELQKVTVLTTKSEQANESISQGLAANHLALSTRIDQQHQLLSDRIDAMGKSFLAQHLSGPEMEMPRLDSASSLAVTGVNTQTVRVVTSHRLPCRSWCPCACHKKSKMKLTAPGLMEGVLGRMFVGYSGLPLLKQPCDFRGCRDRQHPTATVEYWFPSWFVSMNLRLHLTYLPRTGPEFQLSTTRRVADDSQSITFAMQGNIEGLKHLFTQGLAGPRDVSDSRGYTLMRWALYGGMHNYETVQFLINEGALVDEISYENVWDFLFRGKCTEKQRAALRCITEGGEGDWIEEQNFPLVHRIIFGLSTKSLAIELDENPHAVYITDAQNRTALDWATARSQLEDMALLIKYGADPNNMDMTGRTPVLHAVDSHNVDSLRVILKAGGNPNPTYPKNLFRSSPLTAAGFAGMPTLLKLLLDFEANPNASNPEGLTALHSVARTHNTECALLLLEYGANLNAMSSNGQTPLTTAIIHNNHPVLRLFVDRCYEYMTTNRFNGESSSATSNQHRASPTRPMTHTNYPIIGPKILPIIAEHADVETINILASVHPLKVSYDLSFDSIAANRSLLEQRRDYDEKLADAFDELIAIATAEIEETKSVESILESGFFLSAQSTFNSELAGAISALDSVDVTPTDSDNDNDDERWEDTKENFLSPTSPTAIGGEHFQFPTSSTRDHSHATPPAPSPLRREISQ